MILPVPRKSLWSRLSQKTYPLTGITNTVEFAYGALGDGKNGAGWVINIVQGDDLLKEEFRSMDIYGEKV